MGWLPRRLSMRSAMAASVMSLSPMSSTTLAITSGSLTLSSPVSVVVRLMIAEGPKYPDLLQFYWDNVVSRGLGAIREILERGVSAGEFRRSEVTELPHLFVMPVVFSMIFRMLFDAPSSETDRIITTQVDVLIEHMQGAPS